ncbi:hypothetical protein L6452_02469 [Arctium lappa]|uniref:Uncharacterized protein n=1 Tax=Arctium lappa TaxID=4217 RepID=A0ACB9FJN8_ARCLA|nr:hypothetical protein L6452_02469 [Arctium lappa]
MESSWFKKATPKNPQILFEDDNVNLKGKETDTLNAFHIISLLEGFDLSPLFEEKKREKKQEIRFVTMKPSEVVVSKLKEVEVQREEQRQEQFADLSCYYEELAYLPPDITVPTQMNGVNSAYNDKKRL